MMKELKQAFIWWTIVVVGVIYLIGAKPGNLKLFSRFIFQAIIFAGITACLIASYIHIVKRGTNKVRVRLIYTMIGLLVVLAFVFSEVKNNQEKQVIRDVCAQFDIAVGYRDYETAYEFMSPDYRQNHSLAQFIEGKFEEGNSNGVRITCGHRYKSVTVLLLHPGARAASVTHTPFGSLNTEIFLRKVGDKWYFTGKTGGFSG
jgi:hypothetical protein